MTHLAHRTVRAVAILTILLAAYPASAEEEPGGPERRIVGGHRFLLSSSLPDAFVTTHVATTTAAGMAGGFKAPFFDVDGDTLGTLEGDLAFFGLDFAYQQNLFRWASLGFRIGGSGRAGVDEQSLLADGVNTIYGANFEGKVRILRHDKTLLTGLARLSSKSIFGINVYDFAQSVVDGDSLTTDNDLVVEGSVLRLTGGLAGVWAPKPWLGLGAQTHLGYAQPFDDAEANETVFQYAVTASFDLKPGGTAPIGFLLTYDYDSFPEGGSDVAEGIHRTGLGIFYTGKDDFQFGLETTRSSVKQSDVDESFTATSVALNLRYFF